MKTLNVDLDLVKKYNVAGPRYTSYPPATKFTDAVTWDQLSEKIESNNQTPRDLSANSLRRAGDDRDLTGKPVVHPCLLQIW